MWLRQNVSKCIAVVLVVSTIANVLGQDEKTWTKLDAEGKVLLAWSVEGDLITFELNAQTTGFVGFGISPNGGMTNSDIFIGGVYANGTAYSEDRFGVGPTEPYPDDHDDWNLQEASENGTHTYLKYSRLLNTCDEQDYPIGVDTNRLIWALGLTDEVQYHEERKGAKSLYLLGAPNPDVDLSLFQQHTMTLDREMPSDETSYWCSFHRGPLLNQKHHIVAFDASLPSLEAVEHTHHFILYNCYEPTWTNDTLEELLGDYTVDKGYLGDYCYRPYEEGAPLPLNAYCIEYLYVWAKGGEKMIFPENVGYPIGEGEQQGKSAFYMLEIHYDNPRNIVGKKFETGVSFYYTDDELRDQDAGLLMVGHDVIPSLTVPPNIDDFVVVGHCGAECTLNKFPEDGIQVFNSLLHAHLSGRKMKLRQFRGRTELPWLDFDDHYDFDYQLNKPLRDWRVVLPGDHLTYECTYSSVWKYPKVVMGGMGTRDEMCEAFLWYFPKTNVDLCASYYDVDAAVGQFGVTDWYRKDDHIGFATVYVTSPPELEGDFEEVLNTKFNWTEGFKREIETIRRYGDHEGLCIQRTYETDPIFFPVKYPEYDQEYKPIDSCDNQEPTTTPVATTTPVSPGFCADKEDGAYPHPNDCTMYIVCVANQLSIYKCPEGYVFDRVTLTCRQDVTC